MTAKAPQAASLLARTGVEAGPDRRDRRSLPLLARTGVEVINLKKHRDFLQSAMQGGAQRNDRHNERIAFQDKLA